MIARWMHRATDPQEREKGFTLVELLIIMVIIGILAALVLPILRGQSKKGADSSAKSDLRNMITSIEGYYGDANKTSPPNSFNLTTSNNPTYVYNFPGDTNNAIKRSPDGQIWLYADNRSGKVGYCAFALNDKGTAWYWYDSSVGSIVRSDGAYPTSTICADVKANGSTS